MFVFHRFHILLMFIFFISISQIDYVFSRQPSLYSAAMNAITLTFTNHRDFPLRDIRCLQPVLNITALPAAHAQSSLVFVLQFLFVQ